VKIKILKSKNILLIFLIVFAIILSLVGLKNYSDRVRKEGLNELYVTKNRSLAIKTLKMAQIVWPPLYSDKSYQLLLRELKKVEQTPAMVIYFKGDVRAEDTTALTIELQKVKGVKEVKFISQEDALEVYKEANKNHPLLLEFTASLALPESIEVYLDDFTIRNQIEEFSKSKPYVTEVAQLI
jgi:hypothetical protein